MINQFKALIQKRGGLARANRFEIIIPLPAGIPEEDRGRDLTLLCESTVLPGKQIMTNEYSIYGHASKIPYNLVHEDVSCIFNVTNDMYVKKIFDAWQNLVINADTYHIQYDEVFKTDLRIRQLNEDDRPIYEYTLQGAFPISVQAMIVDNNADQQTQKLSVLFTYSKFVHKSF